MKKFQNNKQNIAQNGIALLLTVVILSIVTLIAVLIANIVIVQLKLAKDIGDSQVAIYAADSGVEWQLYQIKKGVSVASPVMLNGSTVVTTVTGVAPSFTIKSLGSYQSVKRQFEVSF
ncbi:MAG: pilus assembly PilX N-terminal domain-containing protein [Parcubacteria group bacterium]|nr:pilus assembly PilX N-terminal domain-containing protein [Parcubacteria group bacterium]